MATSGIATTQRRFHATRSKSSGVYFLPGSIVSPRSRIQRSPDVDVCGDALAFDVLGNADRQHRARSEPVAVDGVVDAKIEVTSQRNGHRRDALIGVEVVVDALAARDHLAK